MICEEVYDSFQAYIQKEVDGEERIQIFEHIQNGSDCKGSYLEQLKIYYTIEREKVMIPATNIRPDFKRDIIAAIDNKDNKNHRFQKKLIWYAVAAVLI